MSDDSAMKVLVIEAMYKSIDEQKREALIKGAIETLLTAKADAYGYRKSSSPLQDAFDQAIQQVARELVIETVRAEGPIRERIKALCGEALGRLLLADDSTLATEIAGAIARSIKQARE